MAGRTEVRIAKQPVFRIHTDLKSAYPTVNANMELERLLMASAIEVRKDDSADRQFLERTGLRELQQRDTWRYLTGIARVRSNHDMLPVRTCFGEGCDTNEALTPLVSGHVAWCGNIAAVCERRMGRGVGCRGSYYHWPTPSWVRVYTSRRYGQIGSQL
jgi:hypothetical protein